MPWSGKPGDPVRYDGGKYKIDVLAVQRANLKGTLSLRDRHTVEKSLPGLLAKMGIMVAAK